jgi:hypothetical protein
MQQPGTSLFFEKKKEVKFKINISSRVFISEYITKNMELVTTFLGAIELSLQINYSYK